MIILIESMFKLVHIELIWVFFGGGKFQSQRIRYIIIEERNLLSGAYVFVGTQNRHKHLL